MANHVDVLKHPVVSVALGTVATAVGAAEAVYRVAERLPVFGPLMRRGISGLSERGEVWVTQSAENFKALDGHGLCSVGGSDPRRVGPERSRQ